MYITNEIKLATVVETDKKVGPVEKTSTAAIKSHDKTAVEPVKDIFEQSKTLEGEDKVIQALVSGAIHAIGLRSLTGSSSTEHYKCSTCGEAKLNHQCGEIRGLMQYCIVLANMVWITPGNALVYMVPVLVAEGCTHQRGEYCVLLTSALWKHRFGLCPVIGAGLLSPQLETRFTPPNESRLLLVESGC